MGLRKAIRVRYQNSPGSVWEGQLSPQVFSLAGAAEDAAKFGYIQLQAAESKDLATGQFTYAPFHWRNENVVVPWHNVLWMETAYLDTTEIDPQMLAHPGFSE